MLNRILLGIVGGAAGTVALNVATYIDMAVRGRPSSTIPAQMAGALADAAGVDLGDENAANRRSGIGALLGYLNGLGTGALYGLASPLVARLPMPIASVLLGAAAMAGSDVPITASGLSNPREWGASGWLSDIGPHLAYGFVAVGVFQWLHGRSKRGWLDW